jgi:Arc/MetJ family transcription regulator
MGVTVNVDDALLAEVREVIGEADDQAAVEKALRELVAIRRQAPLLELEGKLKWEGDLDEMRKGRFTGGNSG